ncbi:MAG: phenylacetate--CoA ligase family protein [Polyangiaceae bacterium]
MGSTAALERMGLARDRSAEFQRCDLGEVLERCQHVDPAAQALGLFHDVARSVPAYARFLAARGIEPSAVRSPDDFAKLPSTSKADYHKAYPLAELCREGALSACDFLAVSSGSTGEPTLWPRAAHDEFGTARRFEQVLVDGAALHQKRTLGVVCFALGSWVGGMYTTFACRALASKGYALTLVTPGNNRAEILRVLRALGPSFEQVVLFGYPPFLKDVIDAGRADGYDWSRLPTRLVMAGEVFSEEWRTLLCERLGAINPERHTASLYGTADGGVLANETPLSVRVRRWLGEHPSAARDLFGEARLPTLCQYDPLHRYFECPERELLFSADGSLPLIKYRILDRGGVVPFERMRDFLAQHGFEIANGSGLRRLPFVYVFGRTGFALSFYGANVYPENVAGGVERAEFGALVTGKFVMELSRGSDQDVELMVTVELAQGAAPSAELERALATSIRQAIERVNSEFSNYAPSERRTPRVRLLPLGDPGYFPLGVKHRYTRGD